MTNVRINLAIVGVPQVTIVAGVLDDDFMRTDGLHFVVKPVAGAFGFALNAVDRPRMHHCACRPGIAIRAGNELNDL